MPALDRRLSRLEARLPEPEPPSPWRPLFPYMTLLELLRLRGICNRVMTSATRAITDAPDQADVWQLVRRAEARRGDGWSPESVAALKKLEKEKGARCWKLVMALHQRSEFPPSHQPRFDVLDVTLAELEELTDLTKTGAARAEFETCADTIRRLRFDERPLTVEAFETMVLRGARRAAPR